MLRKRIASIGLVGVMVGAASVASAGVQFYFTQAGSSTPITNLTLSSGQTTFDLSVWYILPNGGFPNLAADAMVGFDTSNSYGTSATPLDNVFQLNGTPSTAVGNFSTDYASALPPVLTGGQTLSGALDSSIRPYGVDELLANFTTLFDPGQNPERLFDISLMNVGLTPGKSYDVVLWDAGQGFDSTSFLDDGTTQLRQGGSTTLKVTMAGVPEPTGLIALGLGAVALVRRRRTR